MTKEDEYKYIFKVCLIGSGGVGKTCMVRRLCFDTFSLNTQLTVGIDFYTYDFPFTINGIDTKIRLSIWDFGGQERFQPLFRYYINGANGIFLVFDLTQIESLVNLDFWYDKLVEFNFADRPIILVGSKFDLIDQTDNPFILDESLINDSIERYAVKSYTKTSSKDNINIQNIFKEMAKEILVFHEFDIEENKEVFTRRVF
ncbi:MAG: Rab family GTPase [Promethearchaeota archaeon]